MASDPSIARWVEGCQPLPVTIQKIQSSKGIARTGARGEQSKTILNFLPMRDENNRILVQVWLVAAPLEHIPRPGIIIHGLQGGGKTTVAEILRDLLTPLPCLQ